MCVCVCVRACVCVCVSVFSSHNYVLDSDKIADKNVCVI